MRNVLALGAAGVALAGTTPASAAQYVEYVFAVTSQLNYYNSTPPNVGIFPQYLFTDTYTVKLLPGPSTLFIIGCAPNGFAESCAVGASSYGGTAGFSYSRQGYDRESVGFSFSATAGNLDGLPLLSAGDVTNATYSYYTDACRGIGTCFAQDPNGRARFLSSAIGSDAAVTASSVSVVRSISGVPEPASWAMMIAGFGAVGAALRRGRRVRVRFA